MIDFPITTLLDDGVRMLWLERHLHPEGLQSRTAGAWSGAYSVDRGIFQPTAAESPMATIPC
jgi:hypothetical protein